MDAFGLGVHSCRLNKAHNSKTAPTKKSAPELLPWCSHPAAPSAARALSRRFLPLGQRRRYRPTKPSEHASSRVPKSFQRRLIGIVGGRPHLLSACCKLSRFFVEHGCLSMI